MQFPCAGVPLRWPCVSVPTFVPAPPPPPEDHRRIRWLGTLLVAAVGLAWAGSFAGPFVFDDLPSILENESIRRLWPLDGVLLPDQAGGLTTSGRPLLNFSFALNYALSGTAVWSYHAANLAIHAGATLLLFGFVRRTLLTPVLRAYFGGRATVLAAVVAAFWALHPLQTESVTYVVQRAESLAGFFFLLTLYAFARGADGGPRAGRWYFTSVIACVLGMATKEIVAAAPLLVLLWDRTFVSGDWRAAWRRHGRVHLALAAGWLLLAVLVVTTAGRGGTAGFSAGISPWHYALTQCRALMTYLGLAVWPSPLVFDYGLDTERHLGAVLPQALAVCALLGATAWAVVRRPVWGFLGAWFFVLLAPSSSFVPIVTQTMAEHRLYLPLAAPAALVMLALSRVRVANLARLWPVPAAALALLTAARNRDYRSDLALWSDTVAKLPANARAHNNLGLAQFRSGAIDAAVASYGRALALRPEYPETHYNLGVAYAQLGRIDEAIASYGRALGVQPDYPEALNNLGNALVRAGRAAEALARYEEAARRRPAFAEAHNNLGNALAQLDRGAEAEPHFRRALALRPGYAEAHYNWGNALAAAGRMPEALARYEAAVKLNPGYTEAHVNAGNALLALGRAAEALPSYERAAALAPDLPDVPFNLASALLELGRWGDAVAPLERALRLRPDFSAARRALGYACSRLGRNAEALAHYDAYLAGVPDDAEVRAEVARLRAGR